MSCSVGPDPDNTIRCDRAGRSTTADGFPSFRPVCHTYRILCYLVNWVSLLLSLIRPIVLPKRLSNKCVFIGSQCEDAILSVGACRSAFPAHWALSSKPIGQCCCCRSMWQTNGRCLTVVGNVKNSMKVKTHSSQQRLLLLWRRVTPNMILKSFYVNFEPLDCGQR